MQKDEHIGRPDTWAGYALAGLIRLGTCRIWAAERMVNRKRGGVNMGLLSSFLEQYTSDKVGVGSVLIVLAVTCVLAIYIFLVYRVITRKEFYSRTFNVSLAVIAVTTAAIILAVQSSIVISLGMVGALSIVRFRTAIKDPMDLCFLFWSIAVGICCGARVMEVAIILTAVLTILILVLDRVPIGRAPKILIVTLGDPEYETELTGKVEQFTKTLKVKSRTISGGNCNLVYELRMEAEKEVQLSAELSKLEPVKSVSLIAHDGEVSY